MSEQASSASSGPRPPTATLEPFAPPKEYRFEPELAGPAPRTIPPELRQGRHGQAQYTAIRGCLIAGFASMALAEASWVHDLSYYLLPLAYLRWIGLAFLAGALFCYVRDWREGGPYRYVKEGTPFIARIRSLVCQPSVYHHGRPINWRFAAEVERAGPAGLERFWTQSDDLGNAPARFTTSFLVGDYVTGIELPGAKAAARVCLYGFLGLKPGLGVIDSDPTGEHRTPMHRVAAGVLAIALAIWGVFEGLRSMPIAMPGATFWWSYLAAVLASGGPLAVLFRRRHEARRAALARRNVAARARGEALLVDPDSGVRTRRQAIGRVALAMVGVAFVGFFACSAANALLDRGTASNQMVYIDRLIHTTWNGIFREYSIKYHLLDPKGRRVGSQQSLMSTAAQMERIHTRVGLAVIRPGFFGWPWVQEILPLGPGTRSTGS